MRRQSLKGSPGGDLGTQKMKSSEGFPTRGKRFVPSKEKSRPVRGQRSGAPSRNSFASAAADGARGMQAEQKNVGEVGSTHLTDARRSLPGWKRTGRPGARRGPPRAPHMKRRPDAPSPRTNPGRSHTPAHTTDEQNRTYGKKRRQQRRRGTIVPGRPRETCRCRS